MDPLMKALNTATSSGQALLPEDLEPALVEYLGRYMPLWNMIPRGKADSKTHEYTKRTAVPAAWVEGEATPAAVGSSTYERASVQLKILRTWGSVTGFQQKMSEKFIDALRSEIDGSVEGLADLIEFSLLWGDSSDAYQFSGIDTFIRNDSTARANNVFDLNAVISLTDLDNMLDATEGFRGLERDPKMFIASKQMISKITGLQTKIQRTVQEIEFEGGFRMATYRGVPLVPSSFVRPLVTTTSPAVTATASAGGTLADDEWFYRIASVTMYGEQLIGAEDSATTATTNNSVTLTWTADANARLYKIYRGTVTGADNLDLIATIAAKSYDSAGTLSTNIATFIDNGSYTALSEYVPQSAGEESIFLINGNPNRGSQIVGSMSPIGDPLDTFITFTELARVKSTFDYMIESFMALKVPTPSVHAVARRARITT
jgi:hypothetical protein